MKTMLLLFLSIVLSICATAQEERFIFSLDGITVNEKVKLPFSAIQVIDARYDQDNIGCVVKDVTFKGMTENKMQADFPERFKTYLPKVLSNLLSLDQQASDTLVILVKQFRIADHLSNTTDKHLQPASVLSYSWSFYKGKNNRLIKLFSVQDVLSQKWEEGEADQEGTTIKRIKAVLSLLSKAFENRTWTPTQVSFALADVQEGLKKRFRIPILTDSVFVPGIYKNYQEFLNNAPSVSDFKIGRFADEIKEVRDSNSDLIEINSIWGLHDGNDLYINFLGHLWKLYPVNNSFCLVYSRVDHQKLIPIAEGLSVQSLHDRRKGFTSPTGLINWLRKSVRPELLYLNMETGNIHVEELIGDGDVRKLKTWF